jgi:hypothetical protein
MSFLVSGGLREVLSQWLLFGRYNRDIEAKVDEMIAIYMNGVELEENETNDIASDCLYSVLGLQRENGGA